MTDKEKFRKEVEKLKSNLIHGACSSQIAMETRCKEEAYNEVLAILDTMQEEPVSGELEEEIEKYMNALYRNWTEDERLKDSDVEELCKQTARYFTNWQKQKDSIVSEDLEEASKKWLRPQLDKSYASYGEANMMELTHFDGYAMLDAIEFGANWQKTKDESTTKDLGDYINELSKQFPEVSFAKLSRIAVRVAKWQKKRDYIPLSDDINEVARQICNKVLNCEIDYKEGDVVLSDEEECVKAGIRWQMQKESITYDDICEIMEIRKDVLEMDSYENLYEEILKRFKDFKEKKHGGKG